MSEEFPPCSSWAAILARGFLVEQLRVHMGLKRSEACRLVANTFGFKRYDNFRAWHKKSKIDLSGVRGPHSYTLLRMLAKQHGRRLFRR